MNKEKLSEAIAFAREQGLTSIEIEGIRMELGHAPISKEVPDLKASEIVNPPHPFDDMTEEEILFYSTPYFEELQEKKRQRLENDKIDKDLRT